MLSAVSTSMSNWLIAITVVTFLTLAPARGQTIEGELDAARHMIHEEKYKQALSLLNGLAKRNPRNPDVYFVRGLAKLESGDYAISISDFSRAIELNPKEQNYFRFRARALGALDRNDEAIADYTTAIKLSPDVRNNFVDRATLYEIKKDYARAVADYDIILKISRTPNRHYFTHRASNLVKLKQYDRALKDYNQCLKLFPGSADAMRGRADLYRMLGKTDLAIAGYADIRRYNPLDTDAYVNQADLLCQKGEYKTAIDLYTDAMKTDLPDVPSIFEKRAMAYKKLGKHDLAEKDLAQAKKLRGL